MQAKPVRRMRTPAYPTRLEVLRQPALLAERVPHGWDRNPVTAAALTVFLAANACVRAADAGKAPAAKAAVVAPIFAHGEGRGAVGCVAVSPPVFLSEEEALQVITEELTAAGLKISTPEKPIPGVTTTQRMEDYHQTGEKWVAETKETGEPLPLRADAEDAGRHVAVEFVSHEDYHELGGPMSMSTAQGFDFKKVAAEVADTVSKKGAGLYFGALYDPAARPDWKKVRAEKSDEKRWKAMESEAEAESKRLLRLQVKDFVDWLKGQGVI